MKTTSQLAILVLVTFNLFTATGRAQDFTYVANNGTITLTGYRGSDGAVTIPSEINGLPVTSIGEGAFYGCTSLTALTVGGNVTSIGNAAFSGCTGLTTVTSLGSVTTIGEGAFYLCTSLAAVALPSSLNNIGNRAFATCTSLAAIEIPESVAIIGERAFSSCGSLTSLTIPRNVTHIGNSAFICCYSLTGISVDAGNATYSSADGVLFDKGKSTLIQYPIGKVGAYVIPDGVRGIGGMAFFVCSSLTSVTIPASVSTIDTLAFAACGSLTNVSMSYGVNSIGFAAFRSCSIATVTIPRSVTSMGGEAFSYCVNLTSVTFPDSLVGIRMSTFEGCTSLTNVIIPGSVTTIENKAFDGCTHLTSISIPNSVISIGDMAFYNCTSLISVTIPDRVTSIGNYAFGCCTSLTTIAVDPANLAYSSADGVLFDKGKSTLIQYPTGKVGAYAIPDGVRGIGGMAFFACPSLTSVTIPDSVTSIGMDTFQGCAGLTSITVDPLNPAYCSVEGVLFDITKTTLIQYPGGKLGCYVIPNGVRSIGGLGFCANLTSVTIPTSVTVIGGGAFLGCTNLTAVHFHGNAPSFGPFGFIPDNATLYYLPGTVGWDTTFGGRPTALWVLPNPVILTSAPNFGVQTNRFSFVISWATNASVVVEASPTLTTSTWSPVATNALVNGASVFSDAEWTNHPARFYRVHQW